MEELADDPPPPINLEQLEVIRKVMLMVAIHHHFYGCGMADRGTLTLESREQAGFCMRALLPLAMDIEINPHNQV